MAKLSLSVSCIHLELSAAKSLKEQALVLSMILFQRGRKMTELCATRMELERRALPHPPPPRLGERWHPSELAAIDAWIASSNDKTLTRAHAIRRLVALGLKAKTRA
jgi:hypothetical protein